MKIQQTPTLASPLNLNRWGQEISFRLVALFIFKFALLTFAGQVFADTVNNPNIIPQQNMPGPFFIESYLGKSTLNNASYKGVDIGLAIPEANQSVSYYGLLKYVQLYDKRRESLDSDLDEVFLGAGLKLTSKYSPYFELGLDFVDPGGQIFDRFGDGFEILINEIFNNNLGDCRDDDSCTDIQLDRYFKFGLKTTLQQNIILGIFIERSSINSEDGVDTVYYNILGGSIGYRF